MGHLPGQVPGDRLHAPRPVVSFGYYTVVSGLAGEYVRVVPGSEVDRDESVPAAHLLVIHVEAGKTDGSGASLGWNGGDQSCHGSGYRSYDGSGHLSEVSFSTVVAWRLLGVGDIKACQMLLSSHDAAALSAACLV